MQRRFFTISLLFLLIGSNFIPLAYSQPIEIEVERVARRIVSPVAGTHAGDGSGRLFIAEQTGSIKIIQDDEVLDEPFLDVSDKLVNVNSGYDERGLLGLAFHPNYTENGRFFIYYSAPGSGGNHQSILAEYHVSSDDPNKAADDERIIMQVDQPESNHNGGQIVFGPDGMLYIGLGDGGGAGDRHGSIGNGQNLTTLLGSILRINVDGEVPYEVPEDNPFVGQNGRDEIWAYGLRNPWKFSFDRKTGRLFCGDVGQNEWEEIDIIERGGNYGWRVMEASHCFNPSSGCDQSGKILPIDEYNHDLGISITGGYVYRGQQYSSLYGKYIFADWTGKVFYLEETTEGEWTRNEFHTNGRDTSEFGPRILSFAEDEEGELYLLTSSGGPTSPSGMIYKITVPGDEPVTINEWAIH